MATWSTVLGQIRAETEEATAGIWSDAQILVLFNEGARDFAYKVRPLVDEQYVVAATSQKSYTLADYTIGIKSAWWGPTALAVSDYDNICAQTQTGKPSTVAFYDSAAYLWPTPNLAGTLTVLRWLEPTPMTTATNTVPFSDKHTFAVKNFVKARMYEQIQDPLAQSYDALYKRAVAEAEFEKARDNDSAMIRMPSEAW